MPGAPSRATVVWIMTEILKAKREIDAGNKDRYIRGRYVALRSAASRLCQVGDADMDRYIAWLEEQVATGSRIGALTEPAPWVRINCR